MQLDDDGLTLHFDHIKVQGCRKGKNRGKVDGRPPDDSQEFHCEHSTTRKPPLLSKLAHRMCPRTFMRQNVSRQIIRH
jgi:hypothetical protein